MATKQPTTESDSRDVIQHVPYGLRVAAAWGWRLIVVGVIFAAFATVFSTLANIVLPMIIALLIAAPLERVVTRLEALHVPRSLGSAIAILGLLAVFAGLSIAAGTAIARGFEELRLGAMEGFDALLEWLSTGPLDLSREKLDAGIAHAMKQVQDNAWDLASGALSVTGIVGGIVAGIVIALIALFFFLRDGRQMWAWMASLAPGDGVSTRVESAGMGAWITLRRYTQTSLFVAFIDAVGIGLVAWILGVPLALPIAILTFVTAFVPLFGATIAGLVAVLIALVDGGWTTALLMLLGIIVVQQLEGNVLYPWLFGKAARIHPFVIMMTISAGTLLAGLVGALIAVPILAFCYTFVKGLRGEYTPAEEDLRPITSQIPIVVQRGKQVILDALGKSGEIRVRKGKQK